MEKGFLKYILIIAIILVVVFLGRLQFFRDFGKNTVLKAIEPAMTKGASWVNNALFSKIGGGVQGGGAALTNQFNQVQEKISETKKNSENAGEKIKNYFSGVENSILHPGTPQNCLPTQ